MKPLLILATVIGLVSNSLAQQAEVGKPAPNFTLKNASGKSVDLSSFKGKTVVLEWVNFGCPFVKKHYDTKNMQNLQKEAADKGVIWLSICSSAPGNQGNESPGAGAEKAKQYDSNAAAYLLDEDGKVGQTYGAKTTPDMFVINPEGVLVYAGAIDDKPTPDHSTVDTPNNYVRAALNSIADGKPVATPSTKSYGCAIKY